jgi:O-antigen/teichoic acid export membrane protein
MVTGRESMATEQQVVYGVPEAEAARPSPSTETSAPLRLTADRFRAWGLKSALALVDQGIFSGAGFLVNLLLARWLAPASYGAFAVAFAAFLFIAGFHNVLLLEPLTVMGPGRHSENLPAYFRAQLLIHFMLVGGLALAGLLGGVVTWLVRPDSPLVGAIFGSAFMLPVLLLLWLVRRMCYVLLRPSLAVAGTASYLVLIIAGLATLRYFGWATPLLAFLLMGAASLVASAVLLARIGFFRGPGVSSDISWRAALREDWTYGRWLVGSVVLYSASSQVQIFFVSALLGLGAAGILRAVQIPSLVIGQVIAASGLIVLPAFSRDFAQGAIRRLRHHAVLTSMSLAGIAILFAGLTWLIDGPLERFLFAGKYSSYAGLMPLFVLATAAAGLSQGLGMALRAARKPHYDLASNGVATPIAVASIYFFTKWWGLSGAALSIASVFTVQAAITIACFYALLPRLSKLESPKAAQQPSGDSTGDRLRTNPTKASTLS